MTDKYRLMRAEKANYPVKMMARVLGASRSGFYSRLAKGEPDDPWAGLRAEVERVWLESDRTFGARFVLAFLPEEFAGTTLYHVRKCMGELGIRGIAPNSKKRTTVPDEGTPARPTTTSSAPTWPIPSSSTCSTASSARLSAVSEDGLRAALDERIDETAGLGPCLVVSRALRRHEAAICVELDQLACGGA